MKISAKGRYALASIIYMASKYDTGEYITLSNISDNLGFSKIYLEQIFSVIKRAGIVSSIKGAQGGYQLTRSPDKITAFDILSSTENILLEETEPAVKQKIPEYEVAIHNLIFDPLDNTIKDTLKKVTLRNLLIEAKVHKEESNCMFYI